MKSSISEVAEDDLAAICAVIELNRPEVAEAFRNSTEGTIALIVKHPEIGPCVRFQTKFKRLRFFPISGFHKYLIYYQILQDEVSVERVLDGRLDVQRLFNVP